MQRKLNFRAWHPIRGMVKTPVLQRNEFTGDVRCEAFDEKMLLINLELMQYTGLTDVNEVDIYHKDIMEFDNGDRIIIELENWLEFYTEFIGSVECEDQARDFYRIRNAKVIGNFYESPELLDKD